MSSKNYKQQEFNIFPVYKPKGPSSNQYLNRIRSFLGIKKIGHGGTLDPLASGILVIGVGRKATKKLSNYSQNSKQYIAEIKLGVNSTTMDEEGDKNILYLEEPNNLKEKDIKEVLSKFVGKIEQIPPIYSALKINGQSAYKLARKGKDIKMKSREVEIYKIELLQYSWPILKIKVDCGSGMYVRSLANDIGKNLKTGAYLYNLERTKVASFLIKDVFNFEDLKNNIKDL